MISRVVAAAVLVLVAAVIAAAAVRGDPAASDGGGSGSRDARPAEGDGGGSGSRDARPAQGEAVTVAAPPVLGTARSLVGLDGWIQSPVTSLSELRGSVVIVQFWTFGCRNCKATIPNLQALYAEHRAEGLEIVGVHAPEFAHEKDVGAIRAAAEELGVTWPIALDTDKRNFHSWQEGATAYWPRTYVLDREGRIRFDHIGEGAYTELAQTVEALLAEASA